jgi:hypothetical protein
MLHICYIMEMMNFLSQMYKSNDNMYYKWFIRFSTRRGSSNRHENNKGKKILLTLLLDPKFSKANQINKWYD